jgi:hypothetical protein
MSSKTKVLFFRFLNFFLIISKKTFAQEVQLELGKDEIALNEMFTITIKVKNDRLRSYDNFPDIPGFVKRGTSSSSTTNIINGQISSSYSISQNYVPTQEGKFTLSPFTMNINGEKITSKGKTITVVAARQRQHHHDPFGHDPFADFFRRRSEPEFIDVQEDAFLSITTDKEEVYIGEGFTLTYAFYISEDNQAPMQFYDISKQLMDHLKKIRPANCWEENFNIENIEGVPVTINNKRYTQYKLFQATFYPLNMESVEIPSVGLKMIKYKVAKTRSFFGQDKKEDFKTFYTKAKKIKVKDLPPHPLKEKVSVGNFRLVERLNKKELNTGESFEYQFNIVGEGNISGIKDPEVKQGDVFTVFPPNTTQNIRREDNKVSGSKRYEYHVIPSEPGNYNLKDHFSWVYFNPYKHAYDTLTSKFTLLVGGESRKDEAITAYDPGSFYDIIAREDNRLRNLNYGTYFKPGINILILILLALSIVIIYKKK